MVHPIIHRHFFEVEGAFAFQTSYIDPVLMWVRTALVMRVNTADRTEVVDRRPCIESVGAELVAARGNDDVIQIS